MTAPSNPSRPSRPSSDARSRAVASFAREASLSSASGKNPAHEPPARAASLPAQEKPPISATRKNHARKARPPRKSPWRAMAFAAVAVACGVGSIFLVLELAERDSVSDRFVFGFAGSLSERIQENGPILFGNPDGSGLQLYLQHQGDDVERGWSVFDARVGSCVLEWNETAGLFVPPEDSARDNSAAACGEIATVEADGLGQPQYLVEVQPDGRVVADIQNPLSNNS